MEYKRLYKSSTDKAIFGVCGGFAEYFGIDSLIIRLVLVLFTLAFGAGLLFYLIAALIMPKRPEDGGMPVQPQQPGSYNATGTTYVNKASYAESMPQEVSRSTVPAAEDVPQETAEKNAPAEPADPVSRAWAKERQTQEMRGAAAGAPKADPQPQEQKQEPKQEMPKQEPPKPERPYQASQQTANQPYSQNTRTPRNPGDKTRLLLGAILLLIGGFMLVHIFLPRFDTRILFAVCAIIAGAVLILKRE